MSVAVELPRSRLIAAERSAVFLIAVGLMWLARNLDGLGSVAAWFAVVTASTGFLFTAGKALDRRPIARILDEGLEVRPWYRSTVVPFTEISEVLGPVRTGPVEMLNPPGLVVLRISGDFVILNAAADEDLLVFRAALVHALEAAKEPPRPGPYSADWSSPTQPTARQLSWDARLALRMARLDRRQRPLHRPTRRRIRLAAVAIWLTFSVIWMAAMLWIGGLPPKSPIDPLWQPSMTSGLVYGVLGIAGSAIALAIFVPHLIDSTISDEADSDDRGTGR